MRLSLLCLIETVFWIEWSVFFCEILVRKPVIVNCPQLVNASKNFQLAVLSKCPEGHEPIVRDEDGHLDEWIVGDEDCWSQNCSYQGGSCNYCKADYQEGYCCRKDEKYGDNGDCPISALSSMPMWPVHHVCVSLKRNGKIWFRS